jgi:hypothetical protein
LLNPPLERGAGVCSLIAYQVNGSFFVRSRQSDRYISVAWIRLVDPYDSRFLVSKYYCRTIDHGAFSRITTTKLCARTGWREFWERSGQNGMPLVCECTSSIRWSVQSNQPP